MSDDIKTLNKRKLNPKLKKFARELRTNSTDVENLLWYFLRNRQLNGYKFRRQHQIDTRYIVDFVCSKMKLIIELDGGQHNEDENIKYDKKRSEFLKNKGYRILRVWNDEMLKNTENVLETILYYLETNDIPFTSE
jgi:very-short-patch-repair endonuclease